MDLKDIQNLIKFVSKSGASEVKLEMEDIKITIKTGPGKTETTTIKEVAFANKAIAEVYVVESITSLILLSLSQLSLAVSLLMKSAMVASVKVN